MKAEYEKYHRIDRYLRGELQEEELEAFNQDISSNPDFAKEVASQREVNELISANYYHELRQQISQDINKIRHPKSSNKWLGIILILSVLVFVSGYFLMFKKNAEDKGETIANTTIVPATEIPEQQKPLKDTVKMHTRAPLQNKKQTTFEKKNNETGQEFLQDSIAGKEKEEFIESRHAKSSQLKEFTKESKSPDSTSVYTRGILKDLCEKVILHARWDVKKACSNENDGSIMVERKSITGGKDPYIVELFRGNTTSKEPYFDRLNSGLYSLHIKDVNGCARIWNVEVEEEACKTKDISFSPYTGEKWEYHGIAGESYYLSIYDQAGKLIYKSSLHEGDIAWSGINNSGSLVDAGLYIYIVEYANGRKVNGQVTVIQ